MSKTYLVTIRETVVSTWRVQAESDDAAREAILSGEGERANGDDSREFETITHVEEARQ